MLFSSHWIAPLDKFHYDESRPQSPLSRKLLSAEFTAAESSSSDPSTEEELTEQQEVFDRYWHYVQSIPDEVLPTMEPEFWQRVHNRIPKRLIKEDRLAHSRESMKQTVHQQYQLSLKQAIVDYILLEPFEQIRLKIFAQPTLYRPVQSRAPVPWHHSIVDAKSHMEKGLFVTNPMMDKLHDLFQEFQNARIVDIQTFSKANFPMSLEDFQNILRNQCTTFRQHVLNEYVLEVGVG